MDEKTKNLTGLDWEVLNNIRDPDARALLNPVELENALHKLVRLMLAAVDEVMDAMLCEAETTADRFFVAEKAAREGENSEATRLRCRTRLTPSKTLEITWSKLINFPINPNSQFRNKNIRVFDRVGRDGQCIKQMYKSIYIRKGREWRYSIRDLGNEPQWAKKFLSDCEDQNEQLRRKSEIMAKIRRLLYQFDRMTTAYYDPIVHPSFADQRIRPASFRVTRKAETGEGEDEGADF